MKDNVRFTFWLATHIDYWIGQLNFNRSNDDVNSLVTILD